MGTQLTTAITVLGPQSQSGESMAAECKILMSEGLARWSAQNASLEGLVLGLGQLEGTLKDTGA
jgi:hypothetical protein